MSRPVFIFHIGIIVLGIFASLVSIPYLVKIDTSAPQTPVVADAPADPATTTPNTTITAEVPVKPIPKSAPPLVATLPPKTGPATSEPATTTPVVPQPQSKFGKLLEQQAALGIVDPRDEQELWAGVVAIRCSFGPSKAVAGSGIILDNTGLIATNNHVAGAGPNGDCQVLFPSFSDNTGYRIRARGTFPATIVAASGNNENDIAILKIKKEADFESQIEYHTNYYGWTGKPFAFIPYSFCRTASFGDKVIHYDWQVTHSAAEGYEILRAVSTVIEFLSDYNGDFYYTPKGGTPDYIVTDAKKFGGASGGLAFNATKDCVMGLTSRSGEVTYVLNISNPKAKALIPH